MSVIKERSFSDLLNPSTIGECALEFLESKTFCDITFFVGPEEERIECHKLILIFRSPVFEAMFSGRWNGDGNQVVEIPDTEPYAFKLFLNVRTIIC